ncbi:hypothetical protein BCR44DRAFT_1501589 [Catenaria anguillulae PL171]|uniref:Uncharacterized protein n=1 Tax=Catenaria anguillulae PL171 TaxID=765915 RepID=A0A1Y2HG88_9FUNG|nr:hypothetical protein BCR44DRAFT_1501589 [Catenaria anguillulae PL171]
MVAQPPPPNPIPAPSAAPANTPAPGAPTPPAPVNRAAIPVVPPATSLTQPAFGAATGFTSGLIPNAPRGTFPANPAPPVAAPPVSGVSLPNQGTACVPFVVPQGISGFGANTYVLGCIQVATTGNMWACSADQVSTPVGAPSCTVERLNPSCSRAPLTMPPASPALGSSRALLGCIAAASGGFTTQQPADDAFKCQLASGEGSGTCLLPAPPTHLPAPPVFPDDEPRNGEQGDGQVEAGTGDNVSVGVRRVKAMRWAVWLVVVGMLAQQFAGGL